MREHGRLYDQEYWREVLGSVFKELAVMNLVQNEIGYMTQASGKGKVYTMTFVR